MRLSGILQKRRTRRRRFAVVLAFLVMTAGWGTGFVLFVRAVSIAPEPAGGETQAVVVLTGGSLRLEAGLSLLSAGLGKKLFVSGVHRGVDVAELLRVSRQSPKALDCCIVLGYAADNTRGNARETAVWMRREGYRSMRLVTANYHMPRSLLEFRTAMPEVAIVPHPVFPSRVKLNSWWISPGTAFLLAREYSKYLFAWAISTGRALGDAVAGIAT
jgi:uncharacterized SAM-binding protein YcdF (DUF218 family)